MVLRVKRLVNLWIKTRCKIPSVYDITRIKQKYNLYSDFALYFVEAPLATIIAYDATSFICKNAHLFWGRTSQTPCGWMGNSSAQPFSDLSRDVQSGSSLGSGSDRTFTEWSWSHSFIILAVCLGLLYCWEMGYSGAGYHQACTFLHPSFPLLWLNPPTFCCQKDIPTA